MISNQMKFIELNDKWILFDGRKLDIRLVSKKTNLESIYKEQKSHDIIKLNKRLQENTKGNLMINSDNFRKECLSNESELQRLTLNVSNLCNMKCSYCYANEGKYYTKGKIMSKEVALNAINFSIHSFNKIKLVNFFGGEPTLNYSVIHLICEYFKFLYNKGIISYLPQFGITTNAYELNDDMLRLIKDFSFIVNVSLDGPKEVHNRLRKSKDNQGTYDSIVTNIQNLEKLKIPLEFECTFTREHIQQKINLIKLMDFFYENFNCKILHVPLVIIDRNSQWYIPLNQAKTYYSDAIQYSIKNLVNEIPLTISYASRLMQSLQSKIPIRHYCPAGQKALTINADGSIYACFMLMQDKDYSFGDIKDYKIDFGKNNKINKLLHIFNKYKNKECNKCWAQSLCFGCIGEDIVRTKTLSHQSKTEGISEICDFKRNLIETTLKALVEIHISTK